MRPRKKNVRRVVLGVGIIYGGWHRIGVARRVKGTKDSWSYGPIRPRSGSGIVMNRTMIRLVAEVIK